MAQLLLLSLLVGAVGLLADATTDSDYYYHVNAHVMERILNERFQYCEFDLELAAHTAVGYHANVVGYISDLFPAPLPDGTLRIQLVALTGGTLIENMPTPDTKEEDVFTLIDNMLESVRHIHGRRVAHLDLGLHSFMYSTIEHNPDHIMLAKFKHAQVIPDGDRVIMGKDDLGTSEVYPVLERLTKVSFKTLKHFDDLALGGAILEVLLATQRNAPTSTAELRSIVESFRDPVPRMLMIGYLIRDKPALEAVKASTSSFSKLISKMKSRPRQVYDENHDNDDKYYLEREGLLERPSLEGDDENECSRYEIHERPSNFLDDVATAAESDDKQGSSSIHDDIEEHRLGSLEGDDENDHPRGEIHERPSMFQDDVATVAEGDDEKGTFSIDDMYEHRYSSLEGDDENDYSRDEIHERPSSFQYDVATVAECDDEKDTSSYDDMNEYRCSMVPTYWSI